MNPTAITAAASAALAVFAGLLARRVASAPGSGDQRPFGIVALSSAVYSGCTVLATSPASSGIAVLLTRLHMASALVQLWGWLRFSQALLNLRPGRAARIGTATLPAAAALSMVPGLAFGDRVVSRADPSIGVVYFGGAPTLLGLLVMVFATAAVVVVLYRFARAWDGGIPYARTVTVAFGALVLFGANDMLGSAGVIRSVHLLDVGFVAPVLAAGWLISGRFVEATRALEALRGRLLAEVEARTSQLAAAFEALHQSEMLATVGQFANGIAHEVNSPASAVVANLHYLEDSSRGGTLPADAGEVAREALGSMKRIVDLVRKLVEAGRVAAVAGAPTVVSVAELVARGTAGARAALPPGVAIELSIPEQLFVKARQESLELVLASLVANATEAIPSGRPGRIAVRGERSGSAIRIAVEDDGAGMSPEVLRRAFEPFFTTKPTGQGVGLGLSVARGLVEVHGGALWLESTPGEGTKAFVELPETGPAPLTTPPPGR